MTEHVLAENGSPDEHPMRKVLRRYGQAGHAWKAEQDRLEEKGRALVFCGKDCPAIYHPAAEHAHTWWDMYRLRELAEYECQLKRAQEQRQQPGVDLGQRMRSAGVGERHLDVLRGSMDERAAFTSARKWWSQPRPMLPGDGLRPARPGPMPYPWLLLLGDRDTGKSTAAAWCLQQHLRSWNWWGAQPSLHEPPPGMYFPAAELLTLHATGWNGEQGRDTLEDLKRTPLLVLDDLGAVAFPEHVLGLLYAVLDCRYREGRKTVMTANLSAQDFERRFDFRGGTRGEDGNAGRIFRRCEERGFIVHLTRRGKSLGGKLTVGGKEAKTGLTS